MFPALSALPPQSLGESRLAGPAADTHCWLACVYPPPPGARTQRCLPPGSEGGQALQATHHRGPPDHLLLWPCAWPNPFVLIRVFQRGNKAYIYYFKKKKKGSPFAHPLLKYLEFILGLFLKPTGDWREEHFPAVKVTSLSIASVGSFPQAPRSAEN